MPAPQPTSRPPTLEIDWVAGHPRGLTPVQTIAGAALIGGTRVLVAQATYAADGGRVWWSDDGSRWHAVDLKGTFFDVTAALDRLFLVGSRGDRAAVWSSTDGRSWTAVADASLTSGAMTHVVATSSGLIGFGRHDRSGTPAIWTSSDGVDWLAATNPSGNSVAAGLRAVGAYDGRAMAVVSAGDRGPSSIWETTGRAEWSHVATLDTEAWLTQIAGGPRGWVAIGRGEAWVSTDGHAWVQAVSGPDVAEDLVADASGFVAVGWIGSLPGETCGDQRPFAGHTWTSSDGRTWQQLPVSDEFRSAMVAQLLVDDRTLVGFGNRIDVAFGEDLPLQTWTAPLPTLSSPGAADEPTMPQPCGG